MERKFSTNSGAFGCQSLLVAVLRDLRPSIVLGTNGLQWRLVVAVDGNWICNKVNCDLS